MPDREKVIKGTKDGIAFAESRGFGGLANTMRDALTMLKKQPEIVRCKYCIHKGKIEKCVLAAIAAEKDYPLFMLDNRGEWYCADGKRRGTGMTNEDAIKWLENLRQDIGQLRHEDLWHYEQAIVEIIELLEDLEKKYTSLLNEKVSELIEENAKLNLEMNQSISERSDT